MTTMDSVSQQSQNQRPIKFRIWSKPAKSFCQNFHYKGYVDEMFDDVNFEIWQQFVGVQDINKKDLYEGDIIEFFKGNSSDFMLKARIDYERGAFCATVLNYKAISQMMVCNLINQNKSFEIVGNCLENPELL